MKKLQYSITINAPKEKVWDTMLNKDTYEIWTKPFNAGGSTFRGDWSQDSKMIFIGPDPETGNEGGMVSRIAENRPNEYMSIEHLGIYNNGEEDTTSEEAKKWSPAFENYTLQDKDGGTEVIIDLDMVEEYADMFNDTWPEALQKLKELSEK